MDKLLEINGLERPGRGNHGSIFRSDDYSSEGVAIFRFAERETFTGSVSLICISAVYPGWGWRRFGGQVQPWALYTNRRNGADIDVGAVSSNCYSRTEMYRALGLSRSGLYDHALKARGFQLRALTSQRPSLDLERIDLSLASVNM
jgi:hypothetical protein